MENPCGESIWRIHMENPHCSSCRDLIYLVRVCQAALRLGGQPRPHHQVRWAYLFTAFHVTFHCLFFDLPLSFL